MNPRSGYRYIICACSAGLIFINMGLLSTAFSSYFPYMREIKQYTNTQLYLLPTIRSVSTIIFTLCCDAYYRKVGLRKGCLIALLSTALGFLLLSLAPGFWLYEVCMVLFGFSYAMGSIIPASLLVKQWFPVHSAGAMGVVTAGSGVSFIFLPMYIRHFVPTIGLEPTLGMEAVVITLLAGVLFLLIKEAPQSSASANTQTAGNSLSEPETPVLNRFQRVRLYAAFFAIGCLALTGVSGLSMLYSTTGHSVEMASSLISAFGFALIAGKLLYGWLCDRVGSFTTNTIYCVLLAVGMLLCCMAQDAPYALLLCSSCIFSVGCSLASVGLTVTAGDMSNKADFRKMLKNLQFIYSIGGFASGTVPGIIADITGSYVPAYRLFFVISLAIFVLLLPLYRAKSFHPGNT